MGRTSASLADYMKAAVDNYFRRQLPHKTFWLAFLILPALVINKLDNNAVVIFVRSH